jgi:hypothetical protein
MAVTEPTSVEALLRKDPVDLLRTLVDIASADRPLNWNVIRFVARSRAIEATGRTDKKDWAAVAVLAAEKGAAAGVVAGTAAVQGSMMLRAMLISQLEAEPGDPILDIDSILAWFAEEVRGLDPDASWPLETLPIEDIRTGRRIKNDLAALEFVVDDPRYADLPAMRIVRRWWDRRKALP